MATFAGIAVKTDDTLTIPKAFTSFSLLTMLTGPLNTFLKLVPFIAGAVGSCNRVQIYLNSAERKDLRVAQADARQHGDDEHHHIATVAGKSRWQNSAENALDISERGIPRNAFTLLLGPVGCGKSTLLKALLGELSKFRGEMHTSFSGVAFCAQSPWIPNGGMRDIVVGDCAFDGPWYRSVIEACALDEDMRQWSEGDGPTAGSKGRSFSGGQKQRLVRYSTRHVHVRRD